MVKRISLLLVALLLLASGARATHTCSTCYIDYENGSDSNDGTTETTGGGHGPWKHAPGMEGLTPGNVSTGDGCSANCASQVPAAGDEYILKGGVVWPYTTMPWAPYTISGGFAGSGSGSTYGCTGLGTTCIYVGNAVGAGLPAWNAGVVTSITLARDLGGWSSTSPPAITCSGGGGTGAAATAQVIPAAASELVGFIYHTALTSGGSGYTSAPTCTVPNGAGQQTLLVADIDRAVVDMGALQGSPPDWSASGSAPVPYCGAGGNYNIWSGIECRNILIQATTSSYLINGFLGTGQNSTLTNFYIHGLFVDCAYPAPPVMSGTSCNAAITYEQGAVTIANPYSEVSYGTIENGDSFFLGTSVSVAGNICNFVNEVCEYGNFGVQSPLANAGPAEVQHLKIYGGAWQIRLTGTNVSGTSPYLVHDNELWLSMYDVNPSAHINRRQDALQGVTLISYNNIEHDHVQGSGNLWNCPSGMTYYTFNEDIWNVGTSSPPYGMDNRTGGSGGGGGGCTAYFFNNTLNYSNNAPYETVNSNAATVNTSNIVLQNIHSITGPSIANPFWGGNTMVNFEDYAGSTVSANVQAASVVQSSSTASAQGYVAGTLYAPTSPSGATVPFATGGASANLTSLCTGYLAPLCSDINGKPRPATGGWQAGAFVSQNLLPPVLSRTLQ